MTRVRLSKVSLRAGLSMVVLMGIAAVPASAGPPWISVEYPTNPHHPSTRDAAFLVRLYHHSDAISVPITGIAEGLVKGKRTSLALKVESTNLPGVYAVRGVPKDAGAWVMVITMKESGSSEASALVTLGPNGEVVGVKVPSERTADGWVVPRKLTQADVDVQLKQAAMLSQAFQSLAEPVSGDDRALLSLVALPIGLVAFAGMRKRTRSR